MPFWFIDRYLVSQMLMNVLHNAFKFANSRVVLGCREEVDGLLFTIQDDGAGYPDQPGGLATGIEKRGIKKRNGAWPALQ